MEYLSVEGFVFIVVWGVGDQHTTKICAPQIWGGRKKKGKMKRGGGAPPPQPTRASGEKEEDDKQMSLSPKEWREFHCPKQRWGQRELALVNTNKRLVSVRRSKNE